MEKVIQKVTLLLCITLLVHGAPFSFDDSNESSSSSSSSSSSEESKEKSKTPHTLIDDSQSSTNNPTSSEVSTVTNQSYQNVPNIQKRDTISSTSPPLYTSSTQRLNEQNKSPSVLTSRIQNTDGPNTHLESSNKQYPETRGAEGQETHARVLVSERTPLSSINDPQSVHNADNQQIPRRRLDSDLSSTSSTERSDNKWNANTQSTNINQNNRQIRNTDAKPAERDEKQTPSRILSSSHSSSSSIEHPSLEASLHDNKNRPVRDTNIKETSSEISSSDKSSSTTSSTTQHSIFNTDTTPEEITESNTDKNNQENTKSSPNVVSSTETPGDVYGDNRKKTERNVRDTNNDDNVPRVFASNPTQTSSSPRSNIQDENSPKANFGSKQKISPRLAVGSGSNAKSFTNDQSDLHASGSSRISRDTTRQNYPEILTTPNRLADRSSSSTHNTDNSRTTDEPDQVKIVKLTGSPPYPVNQQ